MLQLVHFLYQVITVINCFILIILCLGVTIIFYWDDIQFW